jgi:serine/threonine-protein kinase
MVARMNLCDRRQLQLALADRLLPAQADDLSDHLQHCSHCRSELEQLAGGGQWWSEARTYLSSSDELVAVDDTDSLSQAGEKPAVQSADEEAPLDFLEPPERPGMLGRLGNYDVEAVVGRGGMGVVLKGRDRELDRTVAIKVLAGHLSASAAARKRFAHEAKAAAAVVHDHVIPIHSVVTSGQTPFLVMPLVAGRSLQERLDERGVLETKEVLRIAMQTASGLAAAHAQGLVHRDIKPANILLENGCERVRITDFGLARAVDDASQTQSGFIAGTPQYMAPEQARGEPIDARADLFSLGSVMYAMCTGRPPFRAETTLAVLRRICDDAPRSVREVNPDVPAWLAAIIERLHAKSPADRFQSAAEVANLLQQWLAHLAQPTVNLPPRPMKTKQPPVGSRQRKYWLAGIAAASAVFAAAALGVWVGQWIDGLANNPATVRAAPAAAPRSSSSASQERATSPPAWSDREFRSELELVHAATTALELSTATASDEARLPADELAELSLQLSILEAELAPRPAPVNPVHLPSPTGEAP